MRQCRRRRGLPAAPRCAAEGIDAPAAQDHRNLVLLGLVAIIALLAVDHLQHLRQRLAPGSRSRPCRSAAVDVQAAAGRLAAAVRIRTISVEDAPEQNADALARAEGAYRSELSRLPSRRGQEVIGSLSLLYTWQGSDPANPCRQADRPARASGRGADRAGHRGATRQPAARSPARINERLHLGSRRLGRQGQPLRACWRRPRRSPLPASRRSARSTSPSAMTREISGLRGARAIAATVGRAQRSASTSLCIDEGLLISEGGIEGPGQAGRPDRRRREGLCDAGPDDEGHAGAFLDAAARHRHRHDERGAGQARGQPPADADRRGAVGEMFATLAPEMSGLNRAVLSNLWLFKPLLLRDLEKNSADRGDGPTTTALTIFNAGNKEECAARRSPPPRSIFRLVPGDTQGTVTEHVRRTVANDRIAIAPSASNTDPPPVTATTSPPPADRADHPGGLP